MAEIKVWYGIGMWYCNAYGCRTPTEVRWSTSFGTIAHIADQIIHHIETEHPELANQLPLVRHGEWRVEHRKYDLTPADG